MGFINSISKCIFKDYANFKGRAKRSEYWWFWLFYTIVVLGGTQIAFIAEEIARKGYGVAISGIVCAIIWIAVAIGCFCPYVAVSVRRLRDAGYGWYHIFWSAVPWIGGLITLYLMCQPSEDEDEEMG